jgi:hypothetical protein
MYRYALTGFAIALILGAGYVHGTVTQRWQPSEHLSVAASRLKTLPTTVGDWDSKDIEMNKKHLQVAEVEGYVSRQYYNKKTGERLSFLLICGKPGPISVHSPDVCYEGAGYKMGARNAQAVKVGDQQQIFWTARFTKEPNPAPLQIAWAWSDGGKFIAPDYPRLAFYRASVLYKWYLIREVNDVNSPSTIDDTTQAFIQEVLPQIKSVISGN